MSDPNDMIRRKDALHIGEAGMKKSAFEKSLDKAVTKIEKIRSDIGDQAHQILIGRVQEVSKHFPKRIFHVAFGHGDCMVFISGAPRVSLFAGPAAFNGSYTVSRNWDADDPLGRMFGDIFTEIDLLSDAFQSELNGYAFETGPDFKVQNGKLLDWKSACPPQQAMTNTTC